MIKVKILKIAVLMLLLNIISVTAGINANYESKSNETTFNGSGVVLQPQKIVVINWVNSALTAGFIVLAVVLLFLFIKRKKNKNDNYVDMTVGFGEERDIPKQEKTDKKVDEHKEKQEYKEDKKEKEYKEEKLDNDKKIGESFDEGEKEIEIGEKIIKKKIKLDKKKKGNKKKYKHIKKDNVKSTVSEYILTNENEFKDNTETQDNNIEIKDYSDYEDDDEENKNVFFD
jgi:hypothetical protein